MYFKVGIDSKVWLLWCNHLNTARSRGKQGAHPARGNSPRLNVPADVSYSIKSRSVLGEVPACSVCGKTAGVPPPRLLGADTETKPEMSVAHLAATTDTWHSQPPATAGERQPKPPAVGKDDGAGGWVLTYEMVMRHHDFLRMRRQATAESSDFSSSDSDDGRSLTPLSTVVNYGNRGHDTAEDDTIPSLIRKYHPDITVHDFLLLRRRPDFLAEQLRVCEICYCRYTTSAAAAIGEDRQQEAESPVDAQARKARRRLQSPVESYPETLLPDYCSLRTYQALRQHANRQVSGETRRRQTRIFTLRGDDVPDPVPVPPTTSNRWMDSDTGTPRTMSEHGSTVKTKGNATRGNQHVGTAQELLAIMSLRQEYARSVLDNFAPRNKLPKLPLAQVTPAKPEPNTARARMETTEPYDTSMELEVDPGAQTARLPPIAG